MPLTLVTAFFDLGAREKNTQRRQASEYLRHGEWLLAQKVDLVIYADPAFVKSIWRSRQKHGLLERTAIISMPFESAKYHRYLARIEECRKINPVSNACGFKDTARYMVLTWSKFDLLQRTATWNPFGASHFGWIDFGLKHVAKTDWVEADQLFERPSERIRILHMKAFQKADTEDHNTWARTIHGVLAGGYFTGSTARILELTTLFEAEALRLLQLGFGISEEQLLPIIHHRHPDLFEFYYGDYIHILANFWTLRGDVPTVVMNIRTAVAKNMHELAVDIGRSVWTGRQSGELEASSENLLRIFDSCLTAIYWYERAEGAEKKASADLAQQLLAAFVQVLRENPALQPEFLAEHFVRNFGFHGVDLPAEVSRVEPAQPTAEASVEPKKPETSAGSSS